MKYTLDGKETSRRLKQSPKPSGKIERIPLPEFNCNTQFTLALYAVDDVGQRGEDSNQVIYYIPCPAKSKNLTAGVVAGIIIACLLIIVIIILVLYIMFKDERKEKIKHFKLEHCSCCSKKTDSEFYTRGESSRNTNIQKPPVQEIRTIKDLWVKDNEMDLEDSLNTNQPIESESPSDSIEVECDVQPQEQKLPHSSLSPSSFGSAHSINQVGIPLRSYRDPYSEQDTLPCRSRNPFIPTALQVTPPQMPYRIVKYNTQV